MLLTTPTNVWRGGRNRQRRESPSFGVSLPASVCLSSQRIHFPSAAPGPLLIRLSAARGHRPTLPGLSGVPSPVSRQPGTRGLPALHITKVTPAHRRHRFSVSFMAGCASRCGVRPPRLPVFQMERTRRRKCWAFSAPRTESPPGSGALGLREPLLCWAHRYRVHLRIPSNVSPLFSISTFTHQSREMKHELNGQFRGLGFICAYLQTMAFWSNQMQKGCRFTIEEAILWFYQEQLIHL